MYGLYGTGFAHPIRNGECDSARRPGIMMEPMGSICFKGFKVNLPANRAVGTHRLSAMKPWETSWRMTENIRMMIDRIVSMTKV